MTWLLNERVPSPLGVASGTTWRITGPRWTETTEASLSGVLDWRLTMTRLPWVSSELMVSWALAPDGAAIAGAASPRTAADSPAATAVAMVKLFMILLFPVLRVG